MVNYFVKKVLIKLAKPSRSGRFRQEVIFLCLLILMCILYSYIVLSNTLDLELTRKYVEEKLERDLALEKGMGCEIPKLDPFAKEVVQFDKDVPEIVCPGMDWVKCYHSKCKVIPEILTSVSHVTCSFEGIMYHSDQDYSIGRKWFISNREEFNLVETDHVKVTCSGTNITTGQQVKWHGNTLGFRKLQPKKPPPGREDTFNILIFGFDSAARNGFIRRMPKSWKVLTEELGATVLEGFNILGDGTPAALFPILTGRTEIELPDIRKSTKNNGSMDSFPFLFYKLRDDGYRTAYFEDSPSIGTFQYRFKGWKRQPTDHYLRAFYLEEGKSGGWMDTLGLSQTKTPYCVGDTPQFKMMINITHQFLELDGKKFIFTFIADITHDNFNMITTADNDTAAFFRSLKKYTENTLMVFMGDHGPRYFFVRNTLQGKLEERLPLMAILLPKKLERLRPGVAEVLKQNAHALTTPHDLHAMILDILGMQQHYNPYKVPGAALTRGLSLLKPIPRNRSCSEAGIEAHWCICLKWTSVAKHDPMYGRVPNAVIDHINTLLKEVGTACVPRSLTSVESVTRQKPNSGLLSFRKAKDQDGYIGEFGGKTEITQEYYQVKIVAGPGRSIYDASVLYYTKLDKIVVNDRDISRISAYKNEPHCISKTHPHLNPFCYCQVQIV